MARLQVDATRVRALIMLSRFAEARRLCDQIAKVVASVALRLPVLADEVRAYANLSFGNIARYQGRGEEARLLFVKALKHARNIARRDIEAKALLLLSLAQRDLGELAAAEATAQAALQITQTIGDDYLASNILQAMSVISYLGNQHSQSLARNEQAHTLKQSLGDLIGMLANRLVRIWVLATQGALDEAFALAGQNLR